MLTKPQKQIKSFLQYVAVADLVLSALIPLSGRLLARAFNMWAPNWGAADIIFYMFGGAIFYLLAYLIAAIVVVTNLATLICSALIKYQLFRLVRKDDANVVNFIFKVVIATFATTILAALGIGYLPFTVSDEFLFWWWIIAGMYAIEGVILLVLSLWSGIYKDTAI